jgi:hypothetical protein
VGGILVVDEATMARWGTAGAWRLPVGDARQFGLPSGPDEPAFKLNRGLQRSHGRVTHQGADIANGRGGDTVRAVASGLVLLAQEVSTGNGYGGHVVLAHRLEDGRLAYTVYAHLARGSAGVQAGEFVCAGDPLGLVGRTGRATTPHLHFEVRVPSSPTVRWEHAKAVDPLAFIEARIAEPLDSIPAGAAYIEWARNESLLPAGAAVHEPLTRGLWWRMLAGAAGPEDLLADTSAPALRDSLIDAGLLPEEQYGAPPAERISWSELARDVKRLRSVGVRSPHGPLMAADHQAECESRFGERAPAAHTRALRRLPGDPTAADACVLLADLSGPRTATDLRPEPPPRAKRKGSRRSRPRR